MSSIVKYLAGVSLALVACASWAADLALTVQEIENLGIELAQPTPTESVRGISARATVVIPPVGEQVVSAIRPGSIAQLNVSLGDLVIEGQILGKLQSPDFLSLQRGYLGAFNTDVLTRRQLERDRQLLSEGIISRRRLEETETRAKSAAATLSEHRQLLQLGGMSDQQIAALAEQQHFDDRLAIRAPIAGVVLERMAAVGQRMDAMDPIYRIGDLSELWLEIQLPHEEIAAVAVGMRVAVVGYAVELSAEVVAVAQAVDPVTQMVIARARLTPPHHELKPGQFISVQLVAGSETDAAASLLSVPSSAVIRRDRQTYVFVRTGGGFDVRVVSEVSKSGGVSFLSMGLDAEAHVAISGVSALKAMWAAESGA